MQRALHRVIADLVRRTWLLVLVTVIVCAGFAASAVAALLEASYLAPAPHGAVLPAPRQVPTPVRTTPDGTGLVGRNMFCSTCAPVPGTGPTDAFVPNAILIATSFGLEPRATLRVLGSEAQGSWGLGDKVPGVGTIVRIGWVSIDLVDAAGHHGRLSLLDAAAARGDAGAATPAPAAAADPWADRIRKIDDHTFEVDRDLVRQLVGGSMNAGAGLRILPVTDKGELKGLRMLGVRDGSLPAALGVKNGDVLEALNGTKIQSAQTVIDLFAKLDQLNVVEIDGTRGGKPLELTLRLR